MKNPTSVKTPVNDHPPLNLKDSTPPTPRGILHRLALKLHIVQVGDEARLRAEFG